jgi:hypothetical protein
MWRLSTGTEWQAIAELSEKWSNPFELTLARDFVEKLDTLPEGETGRLLIEVTSTDPASQEKVAALTKLLADKTVLGLNTVIGIPAKPEGPAVACRVRLDGKQALVQVEGSDATAENWLPSGKFSLPLASTEDKFESAKFADSLAEGVLNRLVRTQLTKGPRVKDHPTYQIRIDNASPFVLNGLAVVGTTSDEAQAPRMMPPLCLPPHKSFTVSANEEVVRSLGLRKGIRITALDLSGL